jgi:hypothetical protein
MKFLAGLMSLAVLLTGAAPALAGGYWDARPAPPPQYAEGPPPCHQGCAPPPPCGCWQDRGFHEEAWRRPPPLPMPPPPPSVSIPPEFFESESSVGPAFVDYGGGGGGGGFVETFGSANASAFASASASAHVSVSVNIHQHMMHHPMPHPMPHPCGCGHRW